VVFEEGRLLEQARGARPHALPAHTHHICRFFTLKEKV
jgi:hypothetical protein